MGDGNGDPEELGPGTRQGIEKLTQRLYHTQTRAFFQTVRLCIFVHSIRSIENSKKLKGYEGILGGWGIFDADEAFEN